MALVHNAKARYKRKKWLALVHYEKLLNSVLINIKPSTRELS